MSYPIKTLSELPLLLLGLRKSHKLTQADMARQLGISQQSYAQMEANPAVVSMERLFRVLQLLNAQFIIETVSATPPSMPAPSKQTIREAVASPITKSDHSSKELALDALAHFVKEQW